MKLSFTKMHGLGNDFVFVDGRRLGTTIPRGAIRHLCDRRFGIGADQFLLLGSSRKADFRMSIWNADGSEVEMCGNGLRCLAKYVTDEKLAAKTGQIRVETKAGVQAVKVISKNRIVVDMGEPILKGKEISKLLGRVINRPLRVDGHEFRATCLSMGNPHCVIFVNGVDDLADFPVAKWGPMIERNSLFPKRTNVEFVVVRSPQEIEMRVWERGAGETLACGSGACAAAVAGVLNGMTGRKVDVKLRGGVLQIEWDRNNNHVLMTGPAETVFKGEVEI